MTSVRIVNVDYYMSYPLRELDTNYSEFRGVEVRQVPVIQIFGTSETGHKTCVHIHGVFPYVYIPYDGNEFAGNLSYKIAAELDKALNISLGQASANTCHVHNVVLVSGIPFYGYHERQHQFFKIFFYNPAIIKKACSLLENGAILGKCYQPHESHINYILQFMIDYNLHGMSFVNISRIMYRANPDDPNLLDNIPLNLILSNDIQRRTVCKFEIDAQASCITNKNEISTGKMAVNPGIAALWADEKQRRRDKQMDSQISFCLTLERNEVNPTATHIYFENKLAEKLTRESQSDESSLDLNRSVYPAETPDYSGLVDASTADYTVVDFANTTSLGETIQESQSIHYNENDANLLKILQDLKETAHVDEDSILSQKVKQEKSESSDEDDHNMSLPLRKTVADDESVWEDSYWDENCEIPSQIPQLDGIYDSEDSCQSESDSFNMDEIDDALSTFEPDNWKRVRGETLDKFRYANEVYIHKYSYDIPAEKLLKPGMNKLILTERKSSITPPTCKIKVLRDVSINSTDDIINDLFKMEKESPECDHIDNNYNTDAYLDDFVPNEVIINDVTLGNSTPAPLSTWEYEGVSKSLVNSNSNSRCQSTSSFVNYYDDDDTFFSECDSFNYSLIKEKTPVNSKIDNNNSKKDQLIRKLNCTNHAKRALNYDNLEDEINNKNKGITKIQTKNVFPLQRNTNKSSISTNNKPKIETNVTAEKTIMNPVSPYNLRKSLNKSSEEKKCIRCPVCSESVKILPNRHKNIPILFTEDCYYYSASWEHSNCTILSPERDKILKTETSNNTCTNKDEEKCKYAQVNNLNVDNSGIKDCTSENNYLENVATKNVLETNSSKENIQLLEATNLNWNLDGQVDTPSSDSTLSPDEDAKIINDPKKNNKNAPDKKKKMLCRAPGLTKPVQKTKKTTKKHSRKIADSEIEREIEENKSFVIDHKNIDINRDSELLLNMETRLMKFETENKFTELEELEFSKEKSTEKNSIATEINKNELKVVMLPSELNTLQSHKNKSNKNTEILEGNNSCTDSDDSEPSKNNSVKRNTLNIKANICHRNSSIDSSVNEECVINKKTQMRGIGRPRKTIQSKTEKCDEKKTEILKNQSAEKRVCGRLRKRSKLNRSTDILEGNNGMKFNALNIKSNIYHPNSSSDSSDSVQPDKITKTELVINQKKEKKRVDRAKESIQSETEKGSGTKTEILKNLTENNRDGRLRKRTKSITEIEKTSHVNPKDNTTKMIKNNNPVKNILRNRKVKILKKHLSTKKPTINTVKLRDSKLIKTKQTSNEIKPSISKDKSEIPKTENNSGEKEIRRTVLRHLRSNSSSDSVILSYNNESKKSDTFKLHNKEMLKYQTANENIEDPVKSNDISSYKELPKKVKTDTAMVIKSPLQVKKEIQGILFQNAIVRLDRLRCIESQYSIKNKVNNSEENSENLNISSYSLKDEPHSLKNSAINGDRPKRKSTIKKVNSAQLNKSPVRGTKSKNNVSPKYSPLNVIVRSPKKHSNLIETDSNYEPVAKRLRSELNKTPTENVGNPINTNGNQSEKENLQNFQGTGELQNIPVNQEAAKIQAANVKTNISEPKTCDIDKNKLKCSTPDSIKKKLFNLENNNLSPTCKELKICSYEKLSAKLSSSKCTDIVERDIYYLRRLRQEEENFLKNIDTHYGIKNSQEQHIEQVNKFDNNICYTELTSTDSLNNTIEQIISTPVISETKTINSKLNNKINTNENNTIRRTVKKKDKKPVPPIIPQDFVHVDVTPKEDTSDGSTSFYAQHTTLEDQDEYELSNIENYNTKMNKLTVSEKYDLERDFACQPSTSKSFEEITTNYISSNTSFTSNDISLTDNSFILNYSRYSQNENVSLLELTIKNEYNSRIWMPKYYPPSKEDIKSSLSDYNIPEHRFQQPFYSDYSDVTRKIDIGHNVLKIPSTTIVDLEEFEYSNDFCGIEKWRKEKFTSLYSEVKVNQNFRTTLADHSKIIMTPVNPPPTREDISSWLKTKLNEAEGNLTKKIEKPRIIIPLSPGNSNDSFNESMTLSPCTPDVISPQLSQNVIESSQGTPVSSQNVSSVSRKGKFKKKGNLQRKALFSQPKQNSQEDQKQLKLINATEHYSSNDSCQITGVTMDNSHGFQMSFENLQNAKAVFEHQYLTVLVVELHIRTRGEMYPDPQYDSVRALFYSIFNDVPVDFSLPREETGIIVVDSLPGSPVKQKTPILEGTGVNCKINYVKSEIELIDEFIKLIRKWDPDIFVGFEIEMLSWGYLIERCSVIGINLLTQISRTNPAIIKNKSNDNKQAEQELKLNGRIILDAWRLFRHEIALQSYTFENLMYHILHQRIPAHTFKDLSFWWEYRSNYFRHITANYYITRVEGVLKLLDQLDLIGRTSELARLFGIQFFEVLSRGSQFRVESMMLRLAKPLNFIPISPSVQQRAKMRAPEWVPLILEPESRFYTDPLIVLDFQSLYPSIIIAYNYCFSTCIGRVENLGSNHPFDFGACQLKIKRSNVKRLQNKVNFSPCGVGFVKPEVRQGILPRMLKEILETRLMVKSSMKENKENKLLQRVLHSRQLGLKLIANVTYGYTSANFSGRMPCVEVGDSVVSKGRETLERAIKMIEQTERWRARVVYGDTDSLFVLVPGRSREDAFKIGAEIAEAVTNDNPPPVKLKLEKVYHPALLQTKKRYVGYMYESPDQKEPEYDAKGIETVRRDGCPAVAKMLEKSLRLLFETRDMSLVKRYVCRQFEKLLTGRASIQDLVFAREYRGSGGYRPGACVPALELARRWTAVDKRREPRRNERVPYIVVHGPPGVPLIRLVRCPRELLYQDTSLRPNAVYYITKVIAPPLNRCLSLIGADVQVWYNEMPRKQLQILPTDVHFEQSKKSTISQYFATMSCVVCNNQTRDGLCEDCCSNSQHTVVVLQEKVCRWERSFENIKQICQSCCGRVEYTDCTSLDCPVLYRLNQIKRDLKQVPFVRNLICKF